MTLFSYNIPFDFGSAPNPFWGICSLAICKPVIRRTAEKGDWIFATGSARHGLTNRLVYAMEITEPVISLKEYDEICKIKFPNKIPDLNSLDPKRWVGDSIYDFSGSSPVLRDSVHSKDNVQTDLQGKNVLLSINFWYFGKDAISLDKEETLVKIAHNSPAHKSTSNDRYKDYFVDWIGKRTKPNFETFAPFGLQDHMLAQVKKACSRNDLDEAVEDEQAGSKNF